MTAIKINLTEPLPLSMGWQEGEECLQCVWALELADGRRCRFVSGATWHFRDERMNYFCEGFGEEGLWIVVGLPEVDTIWTVDVGRWVDGVKEPPVEFYEDVPVRRVWR